MSKQDYEMLAASIHLTLQSVQASPAHAACKLEARQALKLLTDRIASGIEDYGYPFDRERFIAACGFPAVTIMTGAPDLRNQEYQIRSGPFGLALVKAPSPREALARFISERVFRSFVRDELQIEETDDGARVTFAGVTYFIRESQ